MTSHCAVAEIASGNYKLYAVSCYFQYSDSVTPHIHHLRNVLQSLSGSKIIIGADVNASSSLWYGKVRATDMERRCAVEEFIAEMNLSIHNTPDAPPTFCSQMGESCIDVTLSSSDGPTLCSSGFRYKTKGADWNFFSLLFASQATDFTRGDLSAEEGAEIMSDTFTYCADIAFGRGSLTSTRRCDWWNNYLVEQRKCFRRARKHLNRLKKRKVTGFAFDEALIAFRVARSRYRASVEKAKGNLLRRVVQRLDSEGPWSPLYHEFKANRSVDLAFVQNIKVNNVHTIGIEETTEVLLDELIPDDVSETDNDYHQQIRSWAAIPPDSPVSDLPSINELVTVVKTLPLNKSSGEDKVSNKMIIEACKSAADAILTVFNRCIAEGSLSMGCPQGSVIGPYLWNLGFDDLLAIPLPSGCTLTGYADDGLLLIQSNTRAGLENLAKDCLGEISRWGERNRLTFAPHKTYQLLLKGNLKSWPSIKFKNVPVKRKESVCYLGLVLEKNFSFIEHIKAISTWGLSFLTLKTIYGATYLGCVCYGAPVWADRATIGAVRRKLLQGQRLALIFLCKAYRTVSTEALPVLAGLLPVDLEVQRRAAMYYNARPNFSANFLAQRDRNKIARLLKPLTDVWDELLIEWQCRWESSTKGRHLYQFFPSVHERLERTWLEVDHCVAQFLTGHGNFKSKLFSFKLVDSPWCQCSTAELQHEQSAHHILWECGLWQSGRNTMLDNLIVSSGVVYYTDLVESRTNFRAFRRFCHTYYWKQSFMSLGRAGLQCSGVFMVVSTVDPGLQELQRCGRLWRACPIKKKKLGKGNWSSVNLTHTAKYNASSVSRRFSAGPFMLKHGSPTLPKL
ncbi:hypothetical protein SFRURICE_017776 [Spodoptera frugiperda]|nr:hypothetical protein SFRURICE_017776 [Spodoptera frugiperda]